MHGKQSFKFRSTPQFEACSLGDDIKPIEHSKKIANTDHFPPYVGVMMPTHTQSDPSFSRKRRSRAHFLEYHFAIQAVGGLSAQFEPDHDYQANTTYKPRSVLIYTRRGYKTRGRMAQRGWPRCADGPDVRGSLSGVEDTGPFH